MLESDIWPDSNETECGAMESDTAAHGGGDGSFSDWGRGDSLCGIGRSRWWVVWCLCDRCKAMEIALLHQTLLCSLDKSFLFFFWLLPLRRKKQSGSWRIISGSLTKSITQTTLSGRNDSLSPGKQLSTRIVYIPHFRNTLYFLLVS